MGCALVCLALGVLAVILGVAGTIYLTGSSSMADPSCWLTENASGCLWISLKPSDSAAVELLGNLTQQMLLGQEELQTANTSVLLNKAIERLRRGRQANPNYMKQFMPLRLALGYEFRPSVAKDPQDEYVLSVDFAKFARMARWSGRRALPSAAIQHPAGFHVAQMEDHLVCFTGSGIAWASRQDMLLPCLDKVATRIQPEWPRSLRKLGEALNPEAPLQGTLTNKNGALGHLIRSMMNQDKKDRDGSRAMINMLMSSLLVGVDGMSLEGWLETPETLTGNLLVFCRNDSTAEIVAMAFFELRDHLNHILSEYEAELRMKKSVKDGCLTMSTEFHGFQSFLVAKLVENISRRTD